tara:strand:+ start:835 stop:2394 length:1560 start_codon:yes stop_codon:yes gene_type:complete
MEGSLHRFRLGKGSAKQTSAGIATKRKRGAQASACARCRGLRRKCVRVERGCEICEKAGLKCSFGERVGETKKGSDQDLPPEMTTWLAVCLNDRVTEDDNVTGRITFSREDAADAETAARYSMLDSESAAVQSSPGTDGPPPGSTTGRQLVEAYFRHIHRSYPFIDRAEVLKDVDVMMGLSDGLEKMSRRLYLVLAIGCTTLRRIGQVSDDICAKFQVSDHAIIQDCLSRNDMESVEELLLLALYSFFDPSLSPWIITGILTRHITKLGLTRKLSNTKDVPLVQIERHRLFWSIYTFDLIVSASMGLPFGLMDPNTNIPLPGITLDEYASPDRAYFTITLQINRHIIALRQLESEILERIHFTTPISLVDSARRSIIADLRHKIEDWYTQGCLVSPLERDQIPFHNTIPWLNCRYQNLLLLLYMPSSLNPGIPSEHLHVLRNAATRYIQLSAVIFQQRHLPLNWVTLCLFVVLCPILFYCTVTGNNVGLDIKEAALSCAEAPESFSETWVNSRRAAKVF